MVIDVTETLKFCFCAVTHEWMSSVFEKNVVLLVVMSLLSSLDDVDFRVELLANYV